MQLHQSVKQLNGLSYKTGARRLHWISKKLRRFHHSPGRLTPLQKWLFRQRRVVLTSSSIAGFVILLRALGFLQPLELSIFDLFFRLRPLEPVDERILIVGINEPDLQAYGFPVSDRDLAQLLQKLNAAQPRAIGLDIYRDLPTEPGHAELEQAFKTLPNLVGIEKFPASGIQAVNPPPILGERNLVGFNNFMRDTDNVVRRGLLYYVQFSDGEIRYSFPLKLAKIYLQEKGLTLPQLDPSQDLQLGQGVIPKFHKNDGAYINADDRGHQFLANLRGSDRFRTVSMSDVLNGKVPVELIRNRIVLIGSTAPSVKDLHLTAYNGRLFQASKPMYGVELMANFISQILSTAIEGRRTIQVMPEPMEWLWILSWSWVGASLCWKLRAPYRSLLMISVLSVSLTGSAYLAFCAGWWVPVLPPFMTLVGSAAVVMAYLAHLQAELKRSTDFLQSVINTIPDPIYVKNKYHQKIVLNQAYCKLVGYPLEVLTEKTDYDLFPKAEADVFWKEDEQAFHTVEEQENEEELTDAEGRTHLIATKRSLHRDAAGNLFLVGVIRDITERKRLENKLKKLTVDLKRSNAELKVSAEHDPLTGLPNRKLFQERLIQSLEWARTQKQQVALFYLDLNDFKPINDNLGHHIGDLLLQTVAQRLRRCLRSSDTVARLGGDEFAVILPGIPKKLDVVAVAEKILHTIQEKVELEGNTISVTTSIGISLFPDHTQDLERLVKKADAAMYRAKRLGKNRYEFAPDQMFGNDCSLDDSPRIECGGF